MSLQKQEVKSDDYIKSGSKKIDGKRATIKLAEQLSTPVLIWLLVKRHKVALLALGNVILVLNWAFPEWPNVVRSMIG